ncbi:hypothetical protein MTO96_002994 [Rhipicephalus appendiculatus]
MAEAFRSPWAPESTAGPPSPPPPPPGVAAGGGGTESELGSLEANSWSAAESEHEDEPTPPTPADALGGPSAEGVRRLVCPSTIMAGRGDAVTESRHSLCERQGRTPYSDDDGISRGSCGAPLRSIYAEAEARLSRHPAML